MNKHTQKATFSHLRALFLPEKLVIEEKKEKAFTFSIIQKIMKHQKPTISAHDSNVTVNS
jgi:hypothetical protein